MSALDPNLANLAVAAVILLTVVVLVLVFGEEIPDPPGNEEDGW